MDYDNFTSYFGLLGIWQNINYFIIMMCEILGGSTFYLGIFVTYMPPNFNCVLPNCENFINEFNESHPCQMSISTYSCSSLSETHCRSKDSKIFFSHHEEKYSIIADFELVCEKEIFLSLIHTSFMIGLMIGSVSIGYISDRFGRKPAMFLSSLFIGVSSLGGAYSNNPYVYALTRFFAAIGSKGNIMIAYTMMIEFVGSQKKNLMGNIALMSSSFGGVLIGLVFAALSNWRQLFYINTALCLLFLPLYFFSSESPRWLISKNKRKEANKVLKYAARLNNKSNLPEELYVKIEDNSVPKSFSIYELFQNSLSRRITLIMFVNWIIISMLYYGVSLRLGSLGGDFVYNNILGASVEIPGFFIAYTVLDIWGRKPVLMTSLLCAGIFLISSAFVTIVSHKIALALLGKLAIITGSAVLYLFTAELYPTRGRSTAIGLCSTVARLGSIAAPQIATYFPKITFEAFPMIFMGSCSLLSGLLSLGLPETLGSPLLENFEDLASLYKHSKPFSECWSKATLKKKIKEFEEDTI